ncbi:MAG: PSD1 domain-containing protein [Verrucomicrobiae bacterium]|nr:PSD1 domain-containing protein [Verrucomicrobiae bacterium]
MPGRIVYLGVWVFGSLAALASAPTADQIEFFEARIRPVLFEHCYSCHSDKAEKIRGGLRLDNREATLKGGSSGPAIVPGDATASLLIKAVRYEDDDLQMPPKDKKLPTEQIADLEAWVNMGAPDPRVDDGPKPLTDIAEARARHWAFQPVQKPAPPKVKQPGWVQSPVDPFILAKLEQEELSPANPADRRTLIRRVSYDLTGLPPTPEEVESFLNDQQPDAYARLVDRLLASPHYGERWGRHWLDVARYADTKGYLAGGEERRYPFSYTYRDYVIRSFNEDKPYDQFLIEQIAADRLPLGEEKDALAALGFLTLGRRFLNNPHDIIDDRIDVVTRGTLGLTVSCARCHDHKFDPISAQDYYALYGVFASSEEPAEKPLLRALHESPDYQDYLKAVAKIEAEIEEFQDKEIAQFIGELRKNVGDYLLGARDAAQLEDQSKFDTFAQERKLIPAVLRRWIKDLDERRKSPDPIFTPWFELSVLAEQDYSANAKPLLDQYGADSAQFNPVLARALTEKPVDSLKSVVEVYNKLFADVDEAWKKAVASATKEMQAPPASLPDADREALRQVLYAEGTPINLPKDEVRTIHARRLREGSAPIRNKIEALSWTHPGVPLRAMALVDKSRPANAHVLLRGNPGNRGPEVPRRFLEVLSESTPAAFTDGSGRLELARSIASRDNPLTARVHVNRVWRHHFGEGLVNTPGDFGVRTESPLHQELLDFLAATFMENGWSTKKLHRLILLSATYQQSSEANAQTFEADPDNRYFSRMNRRRLDFEAMRDTLLAVSGKLDLRMGGVPVDIIGEPFATRRTVYGLIDRQNLPGMFRTFDFANPDVSNQGRFATTVPQQALFMLNSPFVIEQARALVQREEIKGRENSAGKIQAMYELVAQRPPERAELRLAEQFLAAQPATDAKLSPLEQYAQVLLVSNELMFVD